MTAKDDVEVEPSERGWSVSRGGKTLRHFAGNDGLYRACHWAWQWATDRGVRAYLKQGERRARLNFKDDVSSDE